MYTHIICIHAPQSGASNEYSQRIFLRRNKKNLWAPNILIYFVLALHKLQSLQCYRQQYKLFSRYIVGLKNLFNKLANFMDTYLVTML